MTIIVTCPHCGKQFRAADEHAGMRAACPGCHAEIVIPGRVDAASLSDSHLDPRFHSPIPMPKPGTETPAHPSTTHVVVPNNQPNAPGGATDAPGIISLIFGCLSAACMLLGCFTCGVTYFAAAPLAVVGAIVGFFAKGNLKVAGLVLNLLVLIPAIMVFTMFVGGAGLGALSGLGSDQQQGQPVQEEKLPFNTDEPPVIPPPKAPEEERPWTKPDEPPVNLPPNLIGGGGEVPWKKQNSLASFHEDFQATKEGGLPPGWIGDDVVSVRRDAGWSWLQASDTQSHQAKTPAIEFPDDFELETWARLPSRGKLMIRLEGASGGPDLSLSFSDSRYVKLQDTEGTINRSWHREDHAGPVRLRLVRDATIYRVIVEDHVVIEQHLPSHRDFRRIAFGLEGDTATAIYEVALSPHPKLLPRQPATLLHEDFARVRDGDLPPGWRAFGSVGVRHARGISWIEPTVEGSHAVFSPRLVVPDDFELEVLSVLDEGTSLAVALEGKGNSPDMLIKIDLDFRGYHIGFTDAATLDVPGPPSEVHVRLVREGDIFRLSINGKTLQAQRMTKHRDFGRIVLHQGANRSGPARVLRISLVPSRTAGAVNVPVTEPAVEEKTDSGELVRFALKPPILALGFRPDGTGLVAVDGDSPPW